MNIGDQMNIDLEPDCNTFEIRNDGRWNIIVLTNEQLQSLKEFLNNIVGIKNE